MKSTHSMIRTHKLLALLCLSAALALSTAACGADDGATGDANPATDAGHEDVGNVDAIEDKDATEGDTSDESDTQDSDATEVNDGCVNPNIPGDLVLEEDDWFDDWSTYVTVDGTYFQFGFARDLDVTAGAIELAGEAGVFILTGDGCDAQGCAKYFQATAGTLTVTTFEPSAGGAFEATLRDLILEEFDADEGEVREGGESRCLSDTALSMTTLPIPPDPVWQALTCEDGTQGFAASVTEVYQSLFGTFRVTAATGADFPRDELRLELYGDYVPGGVYPIDDLNYNSCSTCLSIQTDCLDAGGNPDADVCQTRYNAGAGTLTVTTYDEETGEFAGIIEGAQFVEVTQQGLHTIVVENGGGWCVDSIALSGTAGAEAP